MGAAWSAPQAAGHGVERRPGRQGSRSPGQLGVGPRAGPTVLLYWISPQALALGFPALRVGRAPVGARWEFFEQCVEPGGGRHHGTCPWLRRALGTQIWARPSPWGGSALCPAAGLVQFVSASCAFPTCASPRSPARSLARSPVSSPASSPARSLASPGRSCQLPLLPGEPLRSCK